MWDHRGAFSWAVSSKYGRHSESVEDIQWSPNEETVFASCSADKTVRVWDTRGGPRECIKWKAHDTDVNVISWNTYVHVFVFVCVCVVCVVCIVYFSHVVMCLVLNPWLSLTSPFSFYLSLSVPTLPHTPSFPALHPRVCLCVHACFCLWCILHYLHLPPPSTGASRPPL